MSEFQSIKTFLLKGMLLIGVERKKIKNTVSWAYVISDLNRQKLLVVFMKKNFRKLIIKNLELKKY